MLRSDVVLHSSDRELEREFDWAKRQALDWVVLGAPVGDYYEAALPGRAAFCMRDVSHQCTGAEVLGLSRLNANMFEKFAAAIDEKLDFCSYWEIDRWNRPCPVDYTSERDFWYNLPANFDVLGACWRMYLWTGDERYISGPAFDRFHQLTMEDYIRRWDRDGDGLPDRVVSEGRRGLVSYDESPGVSENLLVGADLLGAMVRAHLSFADMQAQLGRHEFERIYRQRGQALKDKLNKQWYNEAKGGYACGLDMNRELLFLPDQFGGSFLLYWDLIPDPARARKVAQTMAGTVGGIIVEGLSHMPELLWRYGMREDALRAFRMLTSSSLPRREYPEVSFCAVGAAATGLMGISPDARQRRVDTLSGLWGIEWAEMEHVPALGGLIGICHEGEDASAFTLERGEEVAWRALFRGERELSIDGVPAKAQRMTSPFTGDVLSYVDVPVSLGRTVVVRAV